MTALAGDPRPPEEKIRQEHKFCERTFATEMKSGEIGLGMIETFYA